MRVLFVDDEKRVLDGLRRSLRPLRTSWDMSFLTSGVEVLDTMASEPVDVLVSDMRMPGMDGVELLTTVRAQHPGVVRIVLSGQTDREATMKLAGIAHQFLAKPCDPEELQGVVARATALRMRLSAESLAKLVAGLESLPSMPALYAELMQVMEAPEASITDVAAVVCRDPGMTAKVLQLVNSSFFGLRRRITQPTEAVSLLGLDTVGALVMGHHLFSAFRSPSVGGLSIDALYRETMATAGAARTVAVAAKASKDMTSECYLAGVLHDCGRLVLAANLPSEYEAVLRQVDDGTPLQEAETRAFGASHEDVGAYLLGLWGLPDTIVETAANHHDPSRSPGAGFGSLTAVHVARAAVHDDASLLDDAFLRAAGVDGDVRGWIAAVRLVLDDG